MSDPVQNSSAATGDVPESRKWAFLLTLRDVMRTAYSRGEDRLMSVWERDITAIEWAIQKLESSSAVERLAVNEHGAGSIPASPATIPDRAQAVGMRKTLQWIADQRWNEDADLDDICTRADRELAAQLPAAPVETDLRDTLIAAQVALADGGVERTPFVLDAIGRIDEALAAIKAAPARSSAESEPVGYVSAITMQALRERAEGHGFIVACAGYDTTIPVYAQTPAQPQGAPARDPMKAAVASLAAAISLLERTPKAKKSAPSDKMFDQMLADYRKALADARDALALPRPQRGAE